MRYRLRTLLIVLTIGPAALALAWSVWQNRYVAPKPQWRDAAFESTAISIAQKNGWVHEYNRGAEILRNLSKVSTGEREQIGTSAYQGEKIALFCGCAPPGATNDLVAIEGFYVRVVNASGKDLRPHSVMWCVLVYGEVLLVLPENKIIVIEVRDQDWLVLATQ